MKKNLLFVFATALFFCSCVSASKSSAVSHSEEPLSVRADVRADDKKTPKAKSHSHDFYKSVSEIRANHKEGEDFRIRYKLRKSPVAVFAIHGGRLEKGTSNLAKAVAGKDYSFYLFEVFMKNPGKLHITAANFDDPPALKIAESSMFGLSMHVEKEAGDMICIGGANLEAGKIMADMLVSEGYPVEFPCKRLPGNTRRNIVNRTRLGGVQFEFTRSQIGKIVKNREILMDFAEKLRKTTEKYLNSAEAKSAIK